MYIEEIAIKNLKRISSFKLKFPGLVEGPKKSARMPWTVLIGENGTGKTAILQAIAMSAAGSLQLGQLVGGTAAHLIDRRPAEAREMTTTATFRFPAGAGDPREVFVGLPPGAATPDDVRLRSTLRLRPDETSVSGKSSYVAHGQDLASDLDDGPLNAARSRGAPHWFVAAYGVARILPDASKKPSSLSHTDRLRPLFDSTAALTSTNFANYFADDPNRTRQFAKVLQEVLVPPKKVGPPLLPELVGFTLQGKGGVTKAADILDRHRFRLQMGRSAYNIAGSALAHGYQSTIAWIADLIGHMMLDSGNTVPAHQMTGLVLVDEIDLYIHPSLQISLIRSLQRTFPLVQFVVTTHSPLVLAALRTDEDEIVRLKIDEESGDAVCLDTRNGAEHEPDARLMTSAGIYEHYFGMEQAFAAPEGQWLAEYLSIASNPYRTDAEDHTLATLKKDLKAAGLTPDYPPVDRLRARQASR
jgi:hypothetical protein